MTQPIETVSSEQAKVRKLQPLYTQPQAPLQPTAPLGFDRNSSLESVKPSTDPLFETPHSRKVNPVHDQKHQFLVLLNMLNIAQEVLANTIQHSTDRTNASLKEQHRLLEERGKALEDELRANQSVDWWAAASMIAGYLIDVAMIALGDDAAKIAGAIGLLNRLANDFGITDKFVKYFFQSEETQGQVKEALSYLAAAVRLTALVYMISAAQYTPREKAWKMVDQIKNSAGMAAAAIQLRVKWAEWDHSYAKADIFKFDGKLRMVQHRLQEVMREAQEDPEILENFMNLARRNIPEPIGN